MHYNRPMGRLGVSMHDINRFMEAEKIPWTCPFCGNDAWELLTTSDITGVAPPAIDLRGNKTHSQLDMVPLVCCKCNTLRFLHMPRMMQWVAEHPAEPPQ